MEENQRHTLLNLIDITIALHRRALYDPYRTKQEWGKGHPAIGGNPTPKLCHTCHIIQQAQTTLTASSS